MANLFPTASASDFARTAEPTPAAAATVSTPTPASALRDAAAPLAVPPIEIAIVGDRAGFDALERDWNDLYERAGRPSQLFLGFNWCWHWCNHYLPQLAQRRGNGLAIVTGRIGGRLAMIWPLVRERRRGLTSLAWLGAPVSQYGDVLVEGGLATEALLEAGWQAIRQRLGADLLSLRKVRDDAACAAFLALKGLTVDEVEEAPQVNISGAADYATHELRYSAKQRKNRQRYRRRLAETGQIAYRHFSGDAEAGRRAAEAIAMKRDWLVREGLPSIAFSDRTFDAFFTAAAGADRPAGIDVHALEVNGRPAAMKITVSSKGHMGVHVAVYDPEYERDSPGSLLYEDVIGQAIARGAHTFDLLAPGAQYKLSWADGSVGVRDWSLPLTVKGRLLQRLHQMRKPLKELVMRLPAPVRQWLLGAVLRSSAAN